MGSPDRDWCALIDQLRERGAVSVEVTTHPDGTIASLKWTGTPLRAAPVVVVPKPQTDEDEKPARKPVPAGLGYTQV